MEYEKAQRLLMQVQHLQITSVKQNGRWSDVKQTKMEETLGQLLAVLLGRVATDEEIDGAHVR